MEGFIVGFLTGAGGVVILLSVFIKAISDRENGGGW